MNVGQRKVFSPVFSTCKTCKILFLIISCNLLNVVRFWGAQKNMGPWLVSKRKHWDYTSRQGLRHTLISNVSLFYIFITTVIILLLNALRHPHNATRGANKYRWPPVSEKSLAHGTNRTCMELCSFQGQRDLSEGLKQPWGSGCPGLCARPFHQLAGQERQTEESNSIPAPESLQLLHLHSGAGRTSQNVESTTTQTLSRLSMLCEMVPL